MPAHRHGPREPAHEHGRREPGHPPAGPCAGFSLVELLVVLLVVGILAAIAVPVFVSQRHKAVDAATRADVAVLGRAVSAHFTSSAAVPSVVIVSGSYQVGVEVLARVSDGVVVAGADPATVDAGGWSSGAWCLALTNPAGAVGTFRYSAQQGLQAGACSSSTAP